MANHADIERLIPWYVNGTLNESEMDLVNHHLDTCTRCRESVEGEVRFARRLRAEPAGLAQLAEPEIALRDLIGHLPRQRWRPRAATAALTALMLVIASGSFLVGQQLQPPAFETMTTTFAHNGPIIQLVFEPDMPEHAVRELMLEVDATMIAGPTATGIYRIGLPPGTDGATQVARLRELPAVRWVTLEET